MANKSFSFNKIERSFFAAELKDNKKVLIKMPQKKTFEKMNAFNSATTDIEDTIGALYGLCADIMSNNKTGRSITADYLEKNFDFEEMMIFIEEYTDFVSGVKKDPNS